MTRMNTNFLLLFLLIVAANTVFYYGFQNNYFFSDDFEWLSRAVTMNHSFGEILSVQGRDFNPIFLFLLWLLIKIVGLSPALFRVISLLTFSAAAWMFFYILKRYFKINPIIAFTAALLLSFNVFVSEVVLNLSALVYSLSIFFFLAALKFYFDKKRILFILFLAAGIMTKEAIILGILPFLIFEKENKNRLFTIIATGGIVLIRALLQLGATGSYTDFFSTDGALLKLYFIVLRSMNISPYSLSLAAGIGVIVLLILVSVYLIKFERGVLFFLTFLAVFSLFFAFLPKLSSRYFFYPSFGMWGIAALICQYFFSKNKRWKFALAPLLLISILFNYPLIRNEIEDYKILGDFSNRFIQTEAASIKYNLNMKTSEIFLFKKDPTELNAVYQLIINRDNLPKLLPFRLHSVKGVMKPEHLLPLIFYPEKIVSWKTTKETDTLLIGSVFVIK